MSTTAVIPLPLEQPDDGPVRVRADLDRTDPPSVAAWLARHREVLRSAVDEHGALLVRGLALADLADVASAYEVLTEAPSDDREAFARRRVHETGIYSSAAWPDHEPMCMHHELSYRVEVPGLLLLGCLTAPTTGGGTGIADAAAVLADLPADLVDRFSRTGWMLTRTYGGDIGPSVAGAFGTDDRTAIAAYARANGIELAWRDDGTLMTRQRRAAVTTHPRTGRRCWFNQVAFLSEWTLEPEIREFLVDVYGAEGLPFATAFGDGQPIGSDVVAELNEVYLRHTRLDPWQDGDLLLVDNLATAHSRQPFTGPREIVVGLADPVRLAPFHVDAATGSTR